MKPLKNNGASGGCLLAVDDVARPSYNHAEDDNAGNNRKRDDGAK
jgi:hypothetical protein